MYWPQQVQLAAPAAGWAQPAPQYGWGHAVQMPAYDATQMPSYTQYATAACWPQAAATHPGYYAAAPVQQAAPVDPIQSFIDELGIQPEEDTYFGWLAEYGLQDDALPPEWSIHEDASTGRYYYVDGISGSSSWENPLACSLHDVVEIGRQYLRAPSDEFFEAQSQALGGKHEQNLASWHGPFADESGRNYFSNSVTGESSWRDPRQDTQFMYELENSLLDALHNTLPRPGPDEVPVFGSTYQPPVRTPRQSPQSPKSPDSPGKTWMDTFASASVSQDEQKSTYDNMLKAAEHLHYLKKDEEESQLLLMGRKVRERRKRIERLKKEKEQARRDEEARSRGFANAEEERLFLLRQKSLEEQEAIRKREEAEAEAARQKLLADEEEERRLQEIERKKLAEEEEKKRVAREAEQKREAARQKAEADRLAREARERFLENLPEVVKSRDVKALSGAISEGEAYGYSTELEPARRALEEELQHRKAVALKARKAAEELAGQFKDAKEAQDFGGAILVAQWRAAVREVAKPFQE